MSTIVTRASKGSALTWAEGDANIENLNNDKIESVVEDTAPQLGGDLDVNGNKIITNIEDGDVQISANGEGHVIINGLKYPKNTNFETSGLVIETFDNGFGDVLIRLNNADELFELTPIEFSGSDTSSLGLVENQTYYISRTDDPNEFALRESDDEFGQIVQLNAVSEISDCSWTAVITQIRPGYVVSWDGNQLGLSQPSGGSLSDDPTPQLGGDLNVNGNRIVSTDDGNIELAPDGTGKIRLAGLDWPGITENGPEPEPGGTNTLQFFGSVTAVDVERQPNTLTLSNAESLPGAGIINSRIRFTGSDVATAGLEENVDYFIQAFFDGQVEIATTFGGTPIGNLEAVSPTDFNYEINIDEAPSSPGPGAGGSIAEGAVLTYSGGMLTWAAPTAPPSSISINDLTDTNIMPPVQEGDLIVYDQTSSQWRNSKTLTGYNEKIYSLGSTSGTLNIDVVNGNVQTVTLTGNITINGFSNAQVGQSITLIVNTGGTDRTLTSSMKFAGGDKTISVTDTTDIISVFYDGTNYWASLSKDFK